MLLFQREESARRVMVVLPKRFERFGLQLHPDKTRLLSFDSPGLRRPRAQRERSFDFLGFTHYWGRSRQGRWVVKQRTSKSRFTRSLARLKEKCREMRHWRLAEQHQMLSRMLRGHYNYFGITGNGDALARLGHEAERIWGRSLARRNNRRFAWRRFKVLLTRYAFPKPRPIHSVQPSESAT